MSWVPLRFVYYTSAVFLLLLFAFLLVDVATGSDLFEDGNGFQGYVKNGQLSLTTSVSGIIHAHDGALTNASANDITAASLTGLQISGHEQVEDSDSMLVGIGKLQSQITNGVYLSDQGGEMSGALDMNANAMNGVKQLVLNNYESKQKFGLYQTNNRMYYKENEIPNLQDVDPYVELTGSILTGIVYRASPLVFSGYASGGFTISVVGGQNKLFRTNTLNVLANPSGMFEPVSGTGGVRYKSPNPQWFVVVILYNISCHATNENYYAWVSKNESLVDVAPMLTQFNPGMMYGYLLCKVSTPFQLVAQDTVELCGQYSSDEELQIWDIQVQLIPT